MNGMANRGGWKIGRSLLAVVCAAAIVGSFCGAAAAANPTKKSTKHAGKPAAKARTAHKSAAHLRGTGTTSASPAGNLDQYAGRPRNDTMTGKGKASASHNASSRHVGKKAGLAAKHSAAKSKHAVGKSGSAKHVRGAKSATHRSAAKSSAKARPPAVSQTPKN